MHVALVADWLVTSGGAEQTIAQFLQLWPEATVFTTVARPGLAERLGARSVQTSRLQRLYRLLGRHQLLLPLMPRAMESLDVSGADVVFSSSHAVGKGIIPPSSSVHVCYCHTPMRYAWEMEDQYLSDFGVPRFLQRRIKRMLSCIRRWDLSTAKCVDVFIANSSETQARIQRIYGRESVVVSPPVNDRFFESPLTPLQARTYFLAVGRLVPYKRVDLLIALANEHKLPLVIAGKGQEEKRLRALAGPTVTFHGFVPDNELPALYAQAKAVLFAPHEDAGIVPLEAQACGTPVIAYRKGGALDTIQDGVTGIFFEKQTVASISNALQRFEALTFDPATLREHAGQFSTEQFRSRIEMIVSEAVKKKRR